jgi:uncharacterized protein (TIGR03000 family)
MRKHVLLGIALACVTTLVITDTASAQLLRGRSGRGMSSYGGYGGYGNYGSMPYSNSYYGDGQAYGYNTYGQGYYGTNQGYLNPGYAQFQQGGYYGAPSMTSGSPVTYQNQAFYAGPQDPNAALVRVMVPTPDAQVWIDNQPTQPQGTQRLFISPPLDRGSSYSYQIKATWRDQNGREVTRERTVPIRAGLQAMANFMDNQQQGQQPVSDQNDQQQNRQQRSSDLGTQQPNRQPAVDRTGTNTNPNRPNPQDR